jgi:hypothetical protein
MNIKALITGLHSTMYGTWHEFDVVIVNTSTNEVIQTYSDTLVFGTDLTAYTGAEMTTAMKDKVIAYVLANYSITISTSDIVSATLA